MPFPKIDSHWPPQVPGEIAFLVLRTAAAVVSFGDPGYFMFAPPTPPLY